MSVYEKTLNQLKVSCQLIDIYRDDLQADSLTGFITDLNSDFIYLSIFDDSGLCVGISIIRTSDITRVSWEGNERNAIQQLIDKKESKPLKPSIDLDNISSVIKSTQKEFGYSTFHVEEIDPDICFIGDVIEMDDEHLQMNNYGTMSGRDNNIILLRISDITRIEAEASYEKDIAYLANITN